MISKFYNIEASSGHHLILFVCQNAYGEIRYIEINFVSCSMVVWNISTAFYHLEIPVHIRQAAGLENQAVRGEELLFCYDPSLCILCQRNARALFWITKIILMRTADVYFVRHRISLSPFCPSKKMKIVYNESQLLVVLVVNYQAFK